METSALQLSYAVTVERELADLVPTFMTNRAKELAALRAALATQDLQDLTLLGHRMKGVGTSYGFFGISTIGKAIEDAAKLGNLGAIPTLIASYADYLAKVTVTFKD